MIGMLASAFGARWVQAAILVAVVGAIWGHGWLAGARGVRAAWDAQAAELEIATLRNVERLARIGEQIGAEYLDRAERIAKRGRTIVKEIPKYITVEARDRCVIPRGFVRLHDAAAADRLPEPAADLDAAAAGIGLVTVAGTVTGNYSRCHEIREQLIALQRYAAARSREAQP